jgi:hypothetical protein
LTCWRCDGFCDVSCSEEYDKEQKEARAEIEYRCADHTTR